MIQKLSRLWSDPPAAYVFEISEDGVSMAHQPTLPESFFRPLKPGVVVATPGRDNVREPDQLITAIRELVARSPRPSKDKNVDAALILPDFAVRMSILDFDSLPSDAKEQASLVRFRLKKTVPFDIEDASVSHVSQPIGSGYEVLAAAIPPEILVPYENALRSAGLNPGYVSSSVLSTLSLVDRPEMTLLAKLSGRFLTLAVCEKNAVRLIRCLEEGESGLRSITANLYQTIVFIEDELGSKAGHLVICGFGADSEIVRRAFEEELGIPATVLQSGLGAPGEFNAGLHGYWHGMMAGVA